MMFRKLLALEISALRQQLGELRPAPDGHAPAVTPRDAASTAPLRDAFTALRDAAAPGIWTLRRPV